MTSSDRNHSQIHLILRFGSFLKNDVFVMTEARVFKFRIQVSHIEFSLAMTNGLQMGIGCSQGYVTHSTAQRYYVVALCLSVRRHACPSQMRVLPIRQNELSRTGRRIYTG